MFVNPFKTQTHNIQPSESAATDG